ncbi:MAG: arginine--tRNA ligase, partial [Chloroflexota bacterium]|nr:arginine--tRNA ligase [Chloroflexota bacterium]
MTMVKHEIIKLIRGAIQEAQKQGELSHFALPEITLEHPKRAEHGDYATPICLQLAKRIRMAPMGIARVVVKHLPEADYLGGVEVARPGYINFTLDESWLAKQVETILAAGEAYGDIELGKGKRMQVEFVSANPTGPLTVGSGRNAVIGDTLANVFSAAGYDVRREYYVNDAGTQMELFKETLYARYAQALSRDESIPEQGYRGFYMVEMGREIAKGFGD